MFIGFTQYSGLKYLNRIYEWGKPTYEILGRKRSIIDVGLTNNIRQVKKIEVLPQILGANAQTAHKIIKLTIETKQVKQKQKLEKVKRLRHCSREALIRVRGEVARKCKTLRMLRRNKTDKAYKYNIIRRIYHNAKVKYIGYRKEGSKEAPLTMAIKTTQARIKQTIAQIEREKREDRGGQRSTKQIEVLMQRYQIQEKELYKIWLTEKHQRWVQWIKN